MEMIVKIKEGVKVVFYVELVILFGWFVKEVFTSAS
jgi:hypothetical protein|tara:strand:- start:101 stop:208 length:108 start_codon:yes stop_codon:yes gene_type:complete